MMAALAVRGIPFRRCHEEALSAARFTPDELELRQRELLAEVIRSGAERAPSFGVRLPGSRAETLPDNRSLEGIPPTSKSDLARFAEEAGRERSGLFAKRSSGSSGRPLTVWKDAEGLAREMAATWRGHAWHGVEFGSPGIRLWGRPLKRMARMRRWMKGRLQRIVYIPTAGTSEESLKHRIDRIMDVDPCYIYGYSSSLLEMAHYLRGRGQFDANRLRAVFTTAEPLLPHARQAIQEAFQVPCVNEYGASEVGTIAHECAKGSLHASEDNLILEVEGEGGAISRLGTGALLVTDLTNRITPVVRYRIGDFVTLKPPTCACGLPFKVVEEIHGRVEDTVVTPDGKRHHPSLICYLVDSFTADVKDMEKYQVRQSTERDFTVSIVSRTPLDERALEKSASRAFRNHVHPEAVVRVQSVQDIPREPSGKFRIVISEL